MKSNKTIALLGGDLRQRAAAIKLSDSGWRVRTWGMDSSVRESEIESFGSCSEAMEGADAVILPLPATTDGVLLNCPLDSNETKIRLSEVISYIKPPTVVVGGRIPTELLVRAEAKGLRVYDYFLSEVFQIHNAYTTAEAAVSIAMNSLDRNLCGARIAVTGFGRIAKHLVRLLKAVGAYVTVAARKESDLAWAYSFGCSVIRLGEAGYGTALLNGKFDVIYNTVPHWLFDRDFLEKCDRRTFIIDLASVPGGVDICAAKELGSNVLWATSLPGKYAPQSAGHLIASCVEKILEEEVTWI